MTTDRYESAASAYKNALDKYSGESGWSLAKQQGQEYAKTAGETARGGAYNAARTAGYGKAASYSLANDANNKAVNENLNTGTQLAQQNNSATLTGYGQNFNNQASTADATFKQRTGVASGVAGTVGAIFSALSDENLKEVYIDMDKFRRG